jgi:hypothetical protein
VLQQLEVCCLAYITGISILKHISGAFSGLLAFGISYMGGIEGLEAWSWIFVSSFMVNVGSDIQNAYVDA